MRLSLNTQIIKFFLFSFETDEMSFLKTTNKYILGVKINTFIRENL